MMVIELKPEAEDEIRADIRGYAIAGRAKILAVFDA